MESADLSQHTSRRFNEDMERVTTRVMQMGRFVEQQLQRAVPMVKPKSIDDVPILTLTLWNRNSSYSGYELRRIGAEVCDEIKKRRDVSETAVIGGQRRQLKVTLDPTRLRPYNLSSLRIADALRKANVMLPSGAFPSGNREHLVEAGGFLKGIDEVGSVVVGVFHGRPVYLRDVAALTDGPEEPAHYVFMGLGPSYKAHGQPDRAASEGAPGLYESVTIAVSKKKGANASIVAHEALKKVEAVRGSLVPSDVEVTVTRNYGETAKEKSDELLKHMLIATLSRSSYS